MKPGVVHYSVVVDACLAAGEVRFLFLHPPTHPPTHHPPTHPLILPPTHLPYIAREEEEERLNHPPTHPPTHPLTPL